VIYTTSCPPDCRITAVLWACKMCAHIGCANLHCSWDTMCVENLKCVFLVSLHQLNIQWNSWSSENFNGKASKLGKIHLVFALGKLRILSSIYLPTCRYYTTLKVHQNQRFIPLDRICPNVFMVKLIDLVSQSFLWLQTVRKFPQGYDLSETPGC
jgi:hypothetical protein